MKMGLTDALDQVEEWYLIKFFGKEYQEYRKEVPARIPFIR